jgi:hypothetical protein
MAVTVKIELKNQKYQPNEVGTFERVFERVFRQP